MARNLALTALVSIRTDAAHLAASHFTENYVPPLHELWALANFYERILTQGTEAMRSEYSKPAEERKAALSVVK